MSAQECSTLSFYRTFFLCTFKLTFPISEFSLTTTFPCFCFWTTPSAFGSPTCGRTFLVAHRTTVRRSCWNQRENDFLCSTASFDPHFQEFRARRRYFKRRETHASTWEDMCCAASRFTPASTSCQYKSSLLIVDTGTLLDRIAISLKQSGKIMTRSTC